MSAFSLSAADELVRRVVEEADAKKAAEGVGRRFLGALNGWPFGKVTSLRKAGNKEVWSVWL